MLCRDAPSVSHLLVDFNSLILMNADGANANCLKNILELYYSSSGQLVSVGKSSFFFSPNTLVDIRVEVCTILDIVTEALSDKSLGLPSIVGADRSDCFKYWFEK